MTNPFAPPPAAPAGSGDSMMRPPGRAVMVLATALLAVGALLLLPDFSGARIGAFVGTVFGAIAAVRNGVELTPTHLLHHIGFRTKAYVWSHIVAIGPRNFLGSEGAAITLYTGKRVTLAAPRRGLRAESRARYQADADRLVAYWHAHRGPRPPATHR